MPPSERPNYSVAAMQRAKDLAASGSAPEAIPGILEREGHGHPSESTVRRWVNGHQSQPRLRAQNARYRLPGRSVNDRLAFMRILRAQGVSCRAIGVVSGLVFDDPLSEWQVRQMFAGRDPKAKNFGRARQQGEGAA